MKKELDEAAKKKEQEVVRTRASKKGLTPTDSEVEGEALDGRPAPGKRGGGLESMNDDAPLPDKTYDLLPPERAEGVTAESE